MTWEDEFKNADVVKKVKMLSDNAEFCHRMVLVYIKGNDLPRACRFQGFAARDSEQALKLRLQILNG